MSNYHWLCWREVYLTIVLQLTKTIVKTDLKKRMFVGLVRKQKKGSPKKLELIGDMLHRKSDGGTNQIFR